VPQLPTFVSSSRLQVPGATAARPEEFGAGLGRSLQELGQDLQRLSDVIDQESTEEELRRAALERVRFLNRFSEAIDTAAREGKPFSDAVAPVFNDLDAVAFESPRAAQTWEVYKEEVRGTVSARLVAARAERAKERVKTGLLDLVGNAGKILSSDPNRLQDMSLAVQDFLATFRGSLPEEELKLIARPFLTSLNVSAVNSLIRRDPVAAKQKLQSGEFDLDADTREQLIRFADEYKQAKERDALAAKAQEEQEQRRVSKERADQLFVGIQRGKVTEQQILDDPNLRIEERSFLLNALQEKRNRGLLRESDPTVLLDTWMGVFDGSLKDKDVYNLVKARKLNPRDGLSVIKAIEGMREEEEARLLLRVKQLTDDFSSALRATQLGGVEVATAVNLFRSDLLEKIAKIRERGGDPRSVFDPRSEDYPLRPEALPRYLDEARRVSPAVGSLFVREDGVVRYKGGDLKDPNSYEQITDRAELERLADQFEANGQLEQANRIRDVLNSRVATGRIRRAPPSGIADTIIAP